VRHKNDRTLSRTKPMYVTYGFLVIVLIGVVALQGVRITELTQIENQAKKLLASYPHGYGEESGERGFLLSTLTFLEKHRDRFPATYTRITELYESIGILQPSIPGANTQRADRKGNVTEVAKAIRSFLEGIAEAPLPVPSAGTGETTPRSPSAML
jgi:hypothetical protein